MGQQTNAKVIAVHPNNLILNLVNSSYPAYILIPIATSLTPAQQNQIQAELRPGETLVWTGRPLPRFFRRLALFHVATAMIWLIFTFGFFALWFHFTPRSDLISFSTMVPLVVIGLPFTFIGCLGLYCPFQIPKRAGLTVYALTDRRAIVFGCGEAIGQVKMEIQSYGRDMLATLECREHTDGSGDLILEPLPKMRGTHVMWTPRHGFMAIENVRKVEILVRETLRADASQHVTKLPNRFHEPFRNNS